MAAHPLVEGMATLVVCMLVGILVWFLYLFFRD